MKIDDGQQKIKQHRKQPFFLGHLQEMTEEGSYLGCSQIHKHNPEKASGQLPLFRESCPNRAPRSRELHPKCSQWFSFALSGSVLLLGRKPREE